MPGDLFSLPAEILHHICERLDESDPSSVLPFALTCKKCHAIAKTHLLRTITFHVTKSSLIGRQVRECLDFLDSRGEDSFRQVRRVAITGCCEYEDEATDHLQHRSQQPTRKGNEQHWNLHTPPPILWQANYEKLHHYLPARNESAHRYGAPRLELRPPPEPSRMQAVWRPLVDLLGRFPGLTHLEFDCTSPLPPTILRVLENRKPVPRLSVSKFKLRYEADPESGRRTITHYDLEVIKSPCLYRLCFAPEEIVSDPRNFPMDDIVGTLLRCEVAPNLQEIKFATYFGIPDDELEVEEEAGDSGEVPTKFRDLLDRRWRLKSMHQRNLASLEICSEDTMSTLWQGERIRKSALQTMGLKAHCMALRTLKLSQPVGLDAVVSLMDWVPACLSHLSFCCDPELFGASADNLEYLKQVKKFIRNLEKLASLEIIGWNHTTEPLVSGEPRWKDFPYASPFPPNLHTLLFTPCAVRDINHCIISVEEIECIAKFSPHIQDLSLILGRSMGDATEVAQYRAIGRFRALRNLTLTLDCSHSVCGLLGYKEYKAVPFPFSKLDSHDQSWRERHLFDLIDLKHWNSRPEEVFAQPFRRIRAKRIGIFYEHMVNHAVDEKLASSIFETISRAQGKFHGGGQTQPSGPFGSLERMLFRTTGDESFKHGAANRLDYEMWPFALGLSRSFYMRVDKLSANETTSGPKKALEDDETLPLIIREVGNRFDGRHKWDSWKRLVETGPEELLPYFRHIWGSTGDGKSSMSGWWEDWESFPLQLEE